MSVTEKKFNKKLKSKKTSGITQRIDEENSTKHKKCISNPIFWAGSETNHCRGERIRTFDLVVPNDAR